MPVNDLGDAGIDVPDGGRDVLDALPSIAAHRDVGVPGLPGLETPDTCPVADLGELQADVITVPAAACLRAEHQPVILIGLTECEPVGRLLDAQRGPAGPAGRHPQRPPAGLGLEVECLQAIGRALERMPDPDNASLRINVLPHEADRKSTRLNSS